MNTSEANLSLTGQSLASVTVGKAGLRCFLGGPRQLRCSASGLKMFFECQVSTMVDLSVLYHNIMICKRALRPARFFNPGAERLYLAIHKVFGCIDAKIRGLGI